MIPAQSIQDRFTAAFDAAGPAYAETGAAFLPACAALLLERAALQPGQQVADLATGPGTVARPAAAAVGPEGRVIGVDLSEGQLRLARTALHGQRQCRFARMDISALDMADRRMDAALCSLGLPYVQEPLHALREAVRITRRGGVVVLTTWGEAFFPPAGERLLAALERQEAPLLHRPFTTDPDALAQGLIRAGLREVVVELHHLPVTFPDFAAWWRCNRAFGFLVRADALSRERVQALEQDLRSDAVIAPPDAPVAVSVDVLLAYGRV